MMMPQIIFKQPVFQHKISCPDSACIKKILKLCTLIGLFCGLDQSALSFHALEGYLRSHKLLHNKA